MQKAAPPTVNAYELDVKYQTWRKDIICIAFTYWKQKLHTKAEFLQWNGSDLLPTLFFFFLLVYGFFCCFFIYQLLCWIKVLWKAASKKIFVVFPALFYWFFLFSWFFIIIIFIFFTPFLVKSIYKVLKTNSIKCH